MSKKFVFIFALVFCFFAVFSVKATDTDRANELVEHITELEKLYDSILADKKKVEKTRDKLVADLKKVAKKIIELDKEIINAAYQIAVSTTEEERLRWSEKLIELGEELAAEGVKADSIKNQKKKVDKKIKGLKAYASGIHSQIMDAYDELAELLGLK